MVTTRFAPSPTGVLHIGAARTAYFNWLWARRHRGKYLLRLEDTDKSRFDEKFVRSILEGLEWLGINADEPPVRQSERADRHRQVAEQLLAQNKAYRCYATAEELAQLKQQQQKSGKPLRYDGRWRHRSSAEAPAGAQPTIRFAAPRKGSATIADLIQGEVSVDNKELDDMILLRSDGSPTYMLAVAVDDHDMGVTHVIRGDDHLTNSFRQLQLFHGLGWKPPAYAHMPLLHSAAGGKLSKRSGATGLEEWRRRGFMPQAVLNYLLRLGWSHGDEEIIPVEKALKWFKIEDMGRSAARLDEAKLLYLNGFYMRQLKEAELLEELKKYAEYAEKSLPVSIADIAAEPGKLQLLKQMKARAKTLREMAEGLQFLAVAPSCNLEGETKKRLSAILSSLPDEVSVWRAQSIEPALRRMLEKQGLTLKELALPIRLALVGSKISPPLFAVMEALGKKETLERLKRAAA